jgi:hypothetical protein
VHHAASGVVPGGLNVGVNVSVPTAVSVVHILKHIIVEHTICLYSEHIIIYSEHIIVYSEHIIVYSEYIIGYRYAYQTRDVYEEYQQFSQSSVGDFFYFFWEGGAFLKNDGSPASTKIPQVDIF